MNRTPLIFLGIFAVLAFSWTGIALSNFLGYGSLKPYYDDNDGRAYPLQVSGEAARGKLVYQDLECVACHTQQVREVDLARAWGVRAGVARDYLREDRPLLGDLRIGPDLRNFGARAPTRARLYLHLYDARLTSPASTMPPFGFLFDERKIVGQPSPDALVLPDGLRPPAGYEIVPTRRAEDLVSYLLSLNDTYAYPETRNIYVAPKAGAKEEAK